MTEIAINGVSIIMRAADGQTQGALPTYLRIAEALTIDIAAGRLSPGDKLPPEREFAKNLGTTVTTLRKSLKILAERGLLERRQGSGNYVTDGGRPELGTYALFRLELVPQGGGLPTAQPLSLSRETKPAELPNLGSAQPNAWHIRRLRFLNHIPVALEDIWLDDRFDGTLSRATLSESLYKSYRDDLGLQIVRAEDRLGVSRPPNWAQDVPFEPKDAQTGVTLTQLGLVRRRGFDGYGRVAEVSTTWFDPSRAAYVARIP